MNNKHKKTSICSLILGYLLAIGFFILIILNQKDHSPSNQILTSTAHEYNNTVIHENYINHTVDQLHVRRSNAKRHHSKIDNDYLGENTSFIINESHEDIIHTRDINRHNNHSTSNIGSVSRDGQTGGNKRTNRYTADEKVDLGLLDRRLNQQDMLIDDNIINMGEVEVDQNDINLTNLTVDTNQGDEDLGDIDLNFDKNKNNSIGYEKGELYAYSFPGQGVGAGIGTGTIGAGGGAGAGIGAGVGEGISNGVVVPTLGGVGTYTTPDKSPGNGSGAGGLVAGSGAGGAAGLYTGRIVKALGILPSSTGPGASGYNYDNLPKNGALHIMMHVDGSGSILNTRKQLDIMRDTLLRDALLPYYNNDIDLYNRRVTIVSNSGERTFRFFEEAAIKDNVLAIAFQDEAQPAYHLPNFNKKPEDDYIDDINNLKASLDGYTGLYRGVMFQVDRGKTFAKSFKEFVGNSFKGEGYLESNSLKRYYRDNNTDNIRNRDGIVFSDEYHAKDSGDPSYYLNLILDAVSRVGLNLRINNGGLTDGKHIY